MNFDWIDWSIVAGFLLFIIVIANYTKQYTKTASGFIAANRCAGRYLLTISEGIASVGAFGLIACFQETYQAGFTHIWWKNIGVPIGLAIALSGWVIYRFRQTRALTLAEFMERRYSKRFRIFMGLLIFSSGVLNFGIFPAVSSHFFIHFCGLPETTSIMNFYIPTYPLVMAGLLLISLYFIFIGGQIAVMITDFVQAFFCYIVFIIIISYIFVSLGWKPISEVLSMPENVHMVNPHQGKNIPDFNVWYYIMLTVLSLYQTRAWQGTQGFNSAPLTPHEAKMGGIIGAIRGLSLSLLVLILPIATYTILKHPDFGFIADKANNVLNSVPDKEVRGQIVVPVVMSYFLPKGLLGCFATVFLAAVIGNQGTYLHSWGSIFVQDVVMPLRKKPFTNKQHMLFLRLAIVGVCVFVFFFSLLWHQTEAILLWVQITGAIYLGGAGAVIVGGLYTKKGTTAAAYASMITGSVLALSGIIIKQIYPDFFLNSMQMSFIAAAVACLVYALVSFLAPQKKESDIDKLLHRGEHAVAADVVAGNTKSGAIWGKLGLDKEFNKRDKFIFFFVLSFTSFWFIVLVAETIINLFYNFKTIAWIRYWQFYVILMFVSSIVITIWLGIGGMMDIKKLFERLRQIKHDEQDDGWVAPEAVSDTSVEICEKEKV
ncbi:MAG: hypothetical protein A2Y12_06850 [Planctomycetes bacterium GWF2_42_9]|nr:MAG: hypothetical protein A2Y12_06850 [Planctomycetes bacterium GWF2_42_9]